VRIFLSGIETGLHCLNAAAATRLPHVLTSFHYAQAALKDRARATLWTQVMVLAKRRMIDSGAFSFLYGSGDRSVDFDRYLAEYIDWAARMTRLGFADVLVELDLSQILGYDWVHRQRERVVASGLGERMITVWHSDADWSYWLDMLRDAALPGRSRYVAIEGHHDDREELDYARFIAEAYRRGVRVHGFMITATTDLEKWPFYSVDSTSWLAPCRWGTRHVLSRVGTGATAKGGTGLGPKPGTPQMHYVRPLIQSARTWLEVERRVTESWEARGVDWSAVDS
jgi:hypothetical protein